VKPKNIPRRIAVPVAAVTVLVVEDDRLLANAVVRSLRRVGYLTISAPNALEALRMLSDEEPDIIVLDLGLPDLDGSDALRAIRGSSDVPVVVATARQEELKIVQLLNAGADDYLVKPFSADQLIARLSAVLRRTYRPGKGNTQVLSIGAINIDLALREAHINGRSLDLNRKEFDLLSYLGEHTDRVVTRQELVKEVWGRIHSGREQSVDVHIAWLRRKLGETAARPRYLMTVRGIGFRLADPE
jgi:DNA-binding response OmpR family regulator